MTEPTEMRIQALIIEAYRRGAAAMFDMGRGGLSYTEAWRKVCTIAHDPPNIRDLLEEVAARPYSEIRKELVEEGLLDDETDSPDVGTG